MRIFVVLALVLVAIYMSEARHRKYEDKPIKSYKSVSVSSHHGHHKDSKHDKLNLGPKHVKHMSKLRGKHLNLDTFEKFEGKDIKGNEWKKIPKRSKECKTIKCGPKHFCLTDPTTQNEKCMSYRNFKEGRRLLRSFYKKKRFGKEGRGRMSKYMDRKLEGAEQMKEVYDLLKTYKSSLAKEKSHLKPIDIKEITDAVKEADPNTLEVCRPHEVFELRQRLVGWFVLLHTESRQHHHNRAHQKHKDISANLKHKDISAHLKHKQDMIDHHGIKKGYGFSKHHSKRFRRSTEPEIDVEIHGHCKCSKSVMWEFRRMDTSRDGHLVHDELASIESIKRESCLKPLIKSCDKDTDGRLSRGEWCCCMANTVPPCEEKKRLSGKDEWSPNCDAEGYFERAQCYKGYCWCVDIDGNAIQDTKVAGSVNCGKYDPNGKLIKY